MLASIPVDSPAGIAVGFGSVWVGSIRRNLLTRIDPATDKVIARIDTGMDSCGVPGIGFGRVWVSGCEGSQDTVVVDAATDQVVGKIPHNGLSVGFGAGSVWIGSNPQQSGVWAYRIDPKTLAVQARFKVTGSGVVFGDGSAWIADEGNGTVSRIDPATNKVIATIPAGIPGSSEAFELFAAGKLWTGVQFPSPSAADPGEDKVWRIDPQGNTVKEETLAHLSVTNALYAAGRGSLWVRGNYSKVYRYDARTLKPLGAYPVDRTTLGGFFATGFGSLWLGNLDSNTLWRERIKEPRSLRS